MARLVRVDLGCGAGKPEGYIGIDLVKQEGVDVVWDLNHGIPLPSDFADEVRANHVLEHLEHAKQAEIVTEVWRVLRDGGVFKFEVPSTDGRNAFLPGHTSFWNELSFEAFIQDAHLREVFEIEAQFKVVSLVTKADDDARTAYVVGELQAVKP